MKFLNYLLIWAQQMSNDGSIGLRTAYEEVHLQIGISARLLYALARRFAIVVFAVTNGLLHVGLQEALHHFRVRAFVIVALELYHREGGFEGL